MEKKENIKRFMKIYGCLKSVAVSPWGLLVLAGVMFCGCASPKPPEPPRSPTPYAVRFPVGLAAESAVIPKDNPLTEEKLKLGKALYFEKKLSMDNSLSCASCHIPEKGFADPAQFSSGVGGQKGGRQAPTVINRVFSA